MTATANDCLFCKIINKDIPSDILLENDHCIVIKDINPQAPIHYLILPKKHIATTNDCTPEDQAIMGSVLLTAKTCAEKLGIAEDGYRLIFNCNKNGGQEVYHIHCHLVGGKPLGPILQR